MLEGADLRGVELYSANLFLTDLSDADLRGADLSFANLQEEILTGAQTDSETTCPECLRAHVGIKIMDSKFRTFPRVQLGRRSALMLLGVPGQFFRLFLDGATPRKPLRRRRS